MRILFYVLLLAMMSGFSSFAMAEDDIDIGLSEDLGGLLDSGGGMIFGGYVKNETAYRFDEPRSFTKIRNILLLNLGYDFGRRAKLYSSSWAYYDHVYDLFNYETIVARTKRDEKEPLVFIETLKEEKDSEVAEVRELYLDLYLNNLDIRVGKQYVVWGVIEGIRVVDEINPMNFRELILPEILDYRVPLWTFKADYYLDNSSIQFLAIPDLTFHIPAPAGSEWELFQVLDKTTEPESFNPETAEYGLRYSFNAFDAELSLSFFYTWDDYPTTFRVISSNDVLVTDPDAELAILPTYARMGVFGSTLIKPLGSAILKAELAYVTGKYFAIVDKDEDGDGYLDKDGEVRKDHIRWALGYDFNWGGADFSPAIAQWAILNYHSEILTDEFDTTFNLFIRKPLQKSSAVFSLLGIYLWNFQEIYLKPKITFNLTNHFQVSTGLDYFAGTQTQFGRAADPNNPGGLVDIEQRAQFLGNFRDNRRMFVEFKYSF